MILIGPNEELVATYRGGLRDQFLQFALRECRARQHAREWLCPDTGSRTPCNPRICPNARLECWVLGGGSCDAVLLRAASSCAPYICRPAVPFPGHARNFPLSARRTRAKPDSRRPRTQGIANATAIREHTLTHFHPLARALPSLCDNHDAPPPLRYCNLGKAHHGQHQRV